MISFRQYLLELFDHPLSMERDSDMEDLVRKHLHTSDLSKTENIGAVKVHKLEGNNGHLVHYVKNGIHEIHHLDKDQFSGEYAPKNDKPNPRFVGTMMKYANENILSKNHKLKISATHNMFNHFKKIIHRITKKQGNHVEYGEEKIGSHDTGYAIIHPKKNTHPIFEGML